jgi:hypothetical protein
MSRKDLERRMKPQWGLRDVRKIHARRLPKLGAVQLRRFLKPVAAELGARGGRARMRTMTPEMRHQLGRAGAQARWARRTGHRPQPPPAAP